MNRLRNALTAENPKWEQEFKKFVEEMKESIRDQARGGHKGVSAPHALMETPMADRVHATAEEHGFVLHWKESWGHGRYIVDITPHGHKLIAEKRAKYANRERNDKHAIKRLVDAEYKRWEETDDHVMRNFPLKCTGKVREKFLNRIKDELGNVGTVWVEDGIMRIVNSDA